LIHTTDNRGDISIKADASTIKYTFGDLFASAGVDLSFTSNGAQADYNQQQVYGIKSTASTASTVQALNGTVAMHAGEQIFSCLTGSLSFIAISPIGTATGGNSGISFDSKGTAASLQAIALRNAALIAGRDITVQANDAAGGIVSVYSSGAAAFTATLNMDFSNFGGVGSILVSTGANTGYASPIQISAPESFAVSSNLRSRFSAEDPSGSNIRILSQNDQVNVEQYGLSANGLGIELRANDGSVRAQAHGDGSIVLSAVQGVAARAVNAVNFESTGGAGAIKINGGQLTVRSGRGGVSLVAGAPLTFKASADIDVQTNGQVASDITTVTTGIFSATVSAGPLVFGSNWGDARIATQEGASITLQAPIIAVDASGHFSIPFENREVPGTCTVNGQLARFTTAGLVPSLLGYSPQRPTPVLTTDYNKGRLCVCFGGSWRCARF